MNWYSHAARREGENAVIGEGEATRFRPIARRLRRGFSTKMAGKLGIIGAGNIVTLSRDCLPAGRAGGISADFDQGVTQAGECSLGLVAGSLTQPTKNSYHVTNKKREDV